MFFCLLVSLGSDFTPCSRTILLWFNKQELSHTQKNNALAGKIGSREVKIKFIKSIRNQ